MQSKVLSMLGIAQKAGKVVSGEFSTEKAVKTGKARLVVVSAEASANTKESFRNMTDYYGVPMEIYGTKEELGRCIGKEFRASAAITDENLAKAVADRILQEKKLNNGGN